MPRWELEVSDTLTSWRYKRRTYYPGVYEVTDPSIVDAVKLTYQGVYIRELASGDEAAVGQAVAEGETRPEALVMPQSEGPLSLQELQTPEQTLACPTCGREFKNRKQHYRIRPDHEPAEEGAVAATDEPPMVTGATEEGAGEEPEGEGVPDPTGS